MCWLDSLQNKKQHPLTALSIYYKSNDCVRSFRLLSQACSNLHVAQGTVTCFYMHILVLSMYFLKNEYSYLNSLAFSQI